MTAHPSWCDRAACTADRRGVHRSVAAPVSVATHAVAMAVYLVLFSRFDERQTLLVLAVRHGRVVEHFALGRAVALRECVATGAFGHALARASTWLARRDARDLGLSPGRLLAAWPPPLGHLLGRGQAAWPPRLAVWPRGEDVAA